MYLKRYHLLLKTELKIMKNPRVLYLLQISHLNVFIILAVRVLYIDVLSIK